MKAEKGDETFQAIQHFMYLLHKTGCTTSTTEEYHGDPLFTYTTTKEYSERPVFTPEILPEEYFTHAAAPLPKHKKLPP
ncbi:hypothetical protein CHS0354_007633, partial [Potamilus streckersoni]